MSIAFIDILSCQFVIFIIQLYSNILITVITLFLLQEQYYRVDAYVCSHEHVDNVYMKHAIVIS